MMNELMDVEPEESGSGVKNGNKQSGHFHELPWFVINFYCLSKYIFMKIYF